MISSLFDFCGGPEKGRLLLGKGLDDVLIHRIRTGYVPAS